MAPENSCVVRRFEPQDALAVEGILRKSPEAAAWSLKSIEQLSQRGELAWVIETDGAVHGFLVSRTVVGSAAPGTLARCCSELLRIFEGCG
jgi:hypothetical protein